MRKIGKKPFRPTFFPGKTSRYNPPRHSLSSTNIISVSAREVKGSPEVFPGTEESFPLCLLFFFFFSFSFPCRGEATGGKAFFGRETIKERRPFPIVAPGRMNAFPRFFSFVLSPKTLLRFFFGRRSRAVICSTFCRSTRGGAEASDKAAGGNSPNSTETKSIRWQKILLSSFVTSGTNGNPFLSVSPYHSMPCDGKR